MAEVTAMSTLQHPNIIEYIESFVDDSNLVIVMEYAPSGDLESVIKSHRRIREYIDEDMVLSIFIQLADALAYAHEMKILHRDVKTQNVFMFGERCKLGDFGLTTILSTTQAVAFTRLGTPYYMSPEVCRGVPYSDKNDVWSLGCLLYKLCSLRNAFNGESLKGLLEAICREPTPKPPSRYSRELRSLIKLMLKKDVDSRPTMKQILELPFIQETRARLEGAAPSLEAALDASDSNSVSSTSSQSGAGALSYGNTGRKKAGDGIGAVSYGGEQAYAVLEKRMEAMKMESMADGDAKAKAKAKSKDKSKSKSKSKSKAKSKAKDGSDSASYDEAGKKPDAKALRKHHKEGLAELRELYLKSKQEKGGSGADE